MPLQMEARKFAACLGLAALVASGCYAGAVAPGKDVAATAVHALLDEERNLVTVQVNAGSAAPAVATHALTDIALEGVCTGRIDDRHYLFAFSDEGYLGQWQVMPDASLRFVRYLRGVISSKACHLSATGTDLYVLEEGLGLWRFDPHPEAEPQRRLLERVSPQGRLDPDVESLTIRNGQLAAGNVALPPASQTPAEHQLPTVMARAETAAVQSGGDAADDAAIWHNPLQPAQSRILAADKRFGLRVYALDGRELAALPVGRINNVDLRTVENQPQIAAIAAGSNRSRASISLFAVDPSGAVSELADSEIDTGLDDPYGLCLYRAADGISVFVNDKDGRFQQWRLAFAGTKVSATLTREFRVSGQPEGCVADDLHARLFLGVEDSGVMTLSLSDSGDADLQPLALVDGEQLVADVEGMDIIATKHSGGFLVVSSQGNNSYAVYDREPPHAYRGSFRIGINDALGIDGVSETDGLALHAGDFGAQFPRGLLVVQDGHNVMPEANQNFKLLDWRDVERALGL